ncbi:FUSC family protein [Rhizobium sp. WYJ-E13]|uniref:FUSC family protein n=1 Tax=Rhizobium sp. WYJ-E13 TaxID=2849093 RepID=UPI001C1EF47A|nr:FUSC family protein [Rhizobium sp. WYJ-E13]QWW71140.1 FUSC family protein [Rhizobium sp. WYJ-E13]
MNARPVVTTSSVIFSVKTFIAAMLAYFIAIRFDLPRPSWAVATVYIVANPLSGAVVSKSIYRLLGTLIGGAATIIMVPNLVNEPILLSGAIILWVSGCTFISLLDRTPRSYVPLLAGYTVLLAGLPLVTAPATAFDTAVSRVEEIGLAIICASIVSHIVLPVHVGAVLLDRIDGWIARTQDLLTTTATGKADKTRSRAERLALAAEAADLRSLAVHLQYDGSRYRRAAFLVRSLQHRMVAFLPLLSELADLRRSLERLETSTSQQALSSISQAASCRSNASRNAFRREIDTLVPLAAPPSWEKLVLANVARNLSDILHLADACRDLRDAVEKENVGGVASRFRHRDRISAQHRDFGMALLSALTIAICLVTAMLFWIASGWTDGMTFAQISGVLCCLLATMDDPVPAMRKLADVTIGSVIAAFVYGFAILPMIDGFAPLVAALGLFLIPAGICLAVPSLAIVGMGLCINFPLLLTLQSHQSNDFLAFGNAAIATVLAMIWAILISGIFRSVRAETNARRLFSVSQRHVSKIAAGRHTDAELTHHRLIDVAGLFASRAAKLSPTSDISNGDIIRDLRTGLHLIAVQELLVDLSEVTQPSASAVLARVAHLYDLAPADRDKPLADALGELDDLIMTLAVSNPVDTEEELLMHAVALRICLAPEVDPPMFPKPPSLGKAA